VIDRHQVLVEDTTVMSHQQHWWTLAQHWRLYRGLLIILSDRRMRSLNGNVFCLSVSALAWTPEIYGYADFCTMEPRVMVGDIVGVRV